MSYDLYPATHAGATHWRLYCDGSSEWVRLPEDDESITFDSDDPEDAARWLRDEDATP